MSSGRRRWAAGRTAVGLGAATAIAVALTLATGATGAPFPGGATPAARAADPDSTAGPTESPTASTDPVGDPRVPSGGPGFIGEPMLALGVVLAIGVAALLFTLLYVRLTPGRDDD